MNRVIAVITGDIIGSSHLSIRQRDLLPHLLKECFKNIKESEDRGAIGNQFDILYGDSFQYSVIEVKRSLIVALKIIAYVKMQPIKNDEPKFDVRISIGIGKQELPLNKLRESNEEALRISGRQWDKMKQQNSHISISTSTPDIDWQWEILSLLLDTIISKWTRSQAEVIYYLLKGETQLQIAKRLKITQPSIHQSSHSGNWKKVERAVEMFKTKINN